MARRHVRRAGLEPEGDAPADGDERDVSANLCEFEFASAQRFDPDNRLLSHFPIRRLEAEQIRDAVLAATGELKLEPAGGPGTDQLTPRRSIYSKWLRNAPNPLLNVFDLAEPFQSVAQRNVTTTRRRRFCSSTAK